MAPTPNPMMKFRLNIPDTKALSYLNASINQALAGCPINAKSLFETALRDYDSDKHMCTLCQQLIPKKGRGRHRHLASFKHRKGSLRHARIPEEHLAWQFVGVLCQLDGCGWNDLLNGHYNHGPHDKETILDALDQEYRLGECKFKIVWRYASGHGKHEIIPPARINVKTEQDSSLPVPLGPMMGGLCWDGALALPASSIGVGMPSARVVAACRAPADLSRGWDMTRGLYNHYVPPAASVWVGMPSAPIGGSSQIPTSLGEDYHPTPPTADMWSGTSSMPVAHWHCPVHTTSNNASFLAPYFDSDPYMP